MTQADPADSPLEAAAGVAGPHTTEAFALLGDETRLAILLALWEAYEPDAAHADRGLAFSELFDRVDYDDPGNFNYHLEKLEGQFVRRYEDGSYGLRRAGLTLVQAVIAGAGVQDLSIGPAELDMDCWFCGAPTELAAGQERLFQVCTGCDGIAAADHLPDGALNVVDLHPAGLTDRSPEELLAAGAVAAHRHIRTMYEGLCSTCSGPVDATLDVCTDHDAEGICRTCGMEWAYWTAFRCRVCKDHHRTTPAVVALYHPAVTAFYHDHGESTAFHADDFDAVARLVELYVDHEMTLVREDPPRVRVTAEMDGEAVSLIFDETVTVVDVERRRRG